MATTFKDTPLYGGALTASLPSTYIDASNLRQIPDHQEVFLSPTTLTSIIFEINVHHQPVPSLTSADAVDADVDANAAIYHFTDAIAPTDLPTSHHDPAPTRITLSPPSLSVYPASLLTGFVTTQERRKRGSDALPPDWREPEPTRTVIHQILVRMVEHGTDLCVRVNVPLKEVQGDLMEKEREEVLGKRIVEEIVGTLEIREFGLFDG